jgi:hypothetical protein
MKVIREIIENLAGTSQRQAGFKDRTDGQPDIQGRLHGPGEATGSTLFT